MKVFVYTAAVVLLAFVPSALAAGQAEAFPPVALAGTEVRLVYTIETSALAHVVVQESASCQVTRPDGSSTDCGALGSLVDVRVSATQRAYTFAISAPAEVGNYTATFARSALLDVELPPGDNSAASVVFQVIEERLASAEADDPDPLPPGGGGTGNTTADPTPVTPTPNPPPGGDGTGSSPPPPLAEGDALRWLWSLVMASGATFAAIALARYGGG